MTYSELHRTEKEKGILITNEMLFLLKTSITDQLLFTAITVPSTVTLFTLKKKRSAFA
jgi:hypothetical protein